MMLKFNLKEWKISMKTKKMQKNTLIEERKLFFKLVKNFGVKNG